MDKIEGGEGKAGLHLKVLLVTAFEYPHIGGASTHVTNLKIALEANGHRVETASVSDYPRWFYWSAVKIPSYLINKVRKGWGLIWSHEVRKLLIFFLLIIRRAGQRYDVINAQDPFAVNAIAKYDRIKRLPIVLTIHGYLRGEFLSAGSLSAGTKPDRYFIDQERQAFKRAHRIVAVEKGRRDYAIANGAREEKITIIPNFVEMNVYTESKLKDNLLRNWGIDGSLYIILCPCRLTKLKGVEIALEAMDEVVRRLPGSLLLFAGDGELRKKLEAEASRRGLRKNVRFLGNVSTDKMVELYAISDLVIIPSIREKGAEEGVSMAALEAMASGKPVISTAVGGFKELIRHKETGFVVQERNPSALASAILELASDPETAQFLGDRGRTYVANNHSALIAANRFISLYREAMLDNG